MTFMKYVRTKNKIVEITDFVSFDFEDVIVKQYEERK